MTAQKFILNSKHLLVQTQPHAHVCLHDTTIKDKKSQLSYLNWLRPLIPPQTSKTTAKKGTIYGKCCDPRRTTQTVIGRQRSSIGRP